MHDLTCDVFDGNVELRCDSERPIQVRSQVRSISDEDLTPTKLDHLPVLDINLRAWMSLGAEKSLTILTSILQTVLASSARSSPENGLKIHRRFQNLQNGQHSEGK